uniref:Uncharacterized protein n=1 Tax=Knipowitschia caucasica TaxID=637954 RepID=A0AAV2MQ24_KNICA
MTSELIRPPCPHLSRAMLTGHEWRQDAVRVVVVVVVVGNRTDACCCIWVAPRWYLHPPDPLPSSPLGP